jgi:hypothetical protein
MGIPSSGSTHVDATLSNVSLQYKNEAFIADKILPRVSVGKMSDSYFTYTKGEGMRRQSTLVGPKSKAQEDYFTLSATTYDALYHALQGFVSYADQRAADAPLDLLMDETEYLTNKILLDYEKEVAGLVFASATYASANKASPGTKWGNASSTPISDITTAIDAIVGVQGPFTAAIGRAAWTSLRQHPDILAAFQLSGGGGVLASQQQIAGYFGFDELIIGDSWENTANRGATAAFSRIWSDHMLVFKRANGLKVREVSLGYTFVPEEFKVSRWEDLSLGPDGGEWIKPAWAYDAKVIAADVGYLIYDVVS